MVMLLGVKVPPGVLRRGGLVWDSHPTAASRSRGGLDEYHGAPPHHGHVEVLLKLKGRVVAARGAWER